MNTWHKRRVRLNHDLLKNRLIQSTDRLARILEGQVSGSGLFEEACRTLRDIWFDFVAEAEALLRAFNPAELVEDLLYGPILNTLDCADLVWMRRALVDEYGSVLAMRRDAALALLAKLVPDVDAVIAASADDDDLPSCLREVRTGLRSLSCELSRLAFADLLRAPPAGMSAIPQRQVA